MAEIVLDRMSKEYGNGVRAVKELSLEVGDAEFVVLVGPSGCGKTTALRMIAGLESISDGDLYIGDRRVNDVPARDRDIAMVFQNYALYPHMTVADNIGFSLRMAKTPKREIGERVERAASLLALDGLLKRKPRELSGGQRQRVAMGRAIVREPKAFLMDEPLSNLDAQLRVQMRGEIQALQQRMQVTTVYVTHDQVEAMTMGDRIAVMRDGVLQQIGTPDEVYARPANLFVAGFIGSPPMNLAAARLESSETGAVLHLGTDAVMLAPALIEDRGLQAWLDREVVVGVRPEQLRRGDPSADDLALRVTVDRTESLGADVLAFFGMDAPVVEAAGLTAAAGGESLVPALLQGDRARTVFCARLDPRESARRGDEIVLSVSPRDLHFFDPESEHALRSDGD